ncbi:MAG: carbohydrate kinase family protein [bacterium]
MEKALFDVVGIGCSAVDYLGIAPYYPQPDVKLELLELSQQGGGPVATALVTLARLGARAGYIGKVGDDSLGQFIVREFRKEGVNTDYTIIHKGGSARFAFIVVDRERGTRTIFWSQKGVEPLRPEEVDRRAVLSARILHIDEYEPEAAAAAAVWAKEAGIRVVLDAERVSPTTRKLVESADVVIVPRDFALHLTGRANIESAGEAIYSDHGGIVVMTAGSEGAFCVSDSSKFFQPAFPVDVVDTTGAGDVFHGAFIYGLLQGWDTKEIVEFACAVAAMKCRKLGGRAGIPTLKEVYEFLSERGGGVWKGRVGGDNSGSNRLEN